MKGYTETASYTDEDEDEDVYEGEDGYEDEDEDHHFCHLESSTIELSHYIFLNNFFTNSFALFKQLAHLSSPILAPALIENNPHNDTWVVEPGSMEKENNNDNDNSNKDKNDKNNNKIKYKNNNNNNISNGKQ